MSDSVSGNAGSSARPKEGLPFKAPRTAAEVSALLVHIYGCDPAGLSGVTHIMAVARSTDGLLHALRIGAHAPKSETDFFLLQAVRARVDAILTTSANLRAEPELVHDFVGDSAHALADYRRTVAHKTQPLDVLVLTQSGDVPREHPVWRDSARKHVLVPRAAAEQVRSRVPAQVMVHVIDQLDVRSAVALARTLGCKSISIEAGPTLVRAAYSPEATHEPIVDELCLSSYLGAELAPSALSGALPPDAVLLRNRRLAYPALELEGWSFARYL